MSTKSSKSIEITSSILKRKSSLGSLKSWLDAEEHVKTKVRGKISKLSELQEPEETKDIEDIVPKEKRAALITDKFIRHRDSCVIYLIVQLDPLLDWLKPCLTDKPETIYRVYPVELFSPGLLSFLPMKPSLLFLKVIQNNRKVHFRIKFDDIILSIRDNLLYAVLTFSDSTIKSIKGLLLDASTNPLVNISSITVPLVSVTCVNVSALDTLSTETGIMLIGLFLSSTQLQPDHIEKRFKLEMSNSPSPSIFSRTSFKASELLDLVNLSESERFSKKQKVNFELADKLKSEGASPILEADIDLDIDSYI